MMKNILKVMCVFILFGCAPYSKEEIAEHEKNVTKEVQTFVDELTFVKHKESGLCFAYNWGGLGHGAQH